MRTPQRPRRKQDAPPKKEPYVFRPHRGQQEKYFISTANIVIAGGGAGGGKSMSLFMDAAQGVVHEHYKAAMFRSTSVQIRIQDGLWDESKKHYSKIPGAEPNHTELKWSWQNGASIKFYGCDKPEKFDGLQVSFLGIDELQQFTQKEFWYLISRVRSASSSAPIKIRATCNPEPNWLAHLLKSGGWVGQGGYSVEEMDGVVRWLLRGEDDSSFIWADSPEEMAARYPCAKVGEAPNRDGACPQCGQSPGTDDRSLLLPHARGSAQSVTFIQFRLEDNHTLLKNDPGYRARLESLDAAERRKKLERNWNAPPKSGAFFRAAWWGLDLATGQWVPSDNVVDRPPDKLGLCWSWDVAWSTERADWTVGVLWGRGERYWYVLDAIRFRARAAHTIQVVRRCAESTASVLGQRCAVVLPKDPGLGGIQETEWLRELGALGLEVHVAADTGKLGDKVSRTVFVRSQAEHGFVKVVRNSHPSQPVASWLAQQETFPGSGKLVQVSTVTEWQRQLVEALDLLGEDCPHWVTDWTDAFSKGYNWLTQSDPLGAQRVADVAPYRGAGDPRQPVVQALTSQWGAGRRGTGEDRMASELFFNRR